MPQLSNHLEAMDVDLLIFTPKWFVCLFLNSLPGHVVVKVWDLFFWHQDHSHGVVIWVALALLNGLKEKLCGAQDFEEVMAVLTKGIDGVRSFAWLKRHECVAISELTSKPMDVIVEFLPPPSHELLQNRSEYLRTCATPEAFVAGLSQLKHTQISARSTSTTVAVASLSGVDFIDAVRGILANMTLPREACAADPIVQDFCRIRPCQPSCGASPRRRRGRRCVHISTTCLRKYTCARTHNRTQTHTSRNHYQVLLRAELRTSAAQHEPPRRPRTC